MNRIRTSTLVAAFGLLLGATAWAEAPTDHAAPPGMPPGMPAGHPSMPPGLPGGHPPMPGTAPGRPSMPGQFAGRPAPAHAESHEAHEGAEHGAHHCPGHGPNDPPPPINLWHGLLGVNNEAAQSDSAFKKLLFRYDNHDNPCDPKNEPPPFLASLLNFAVLAFLIGKFAKKPVAEALLKRKVTIMQDIDAATRLREDAEARLEEYEEKLENLDGTLAAAKEEYAAQSLAEKERIIAEAEARRVRMRKDAEVRVEQERKMLRNALMAEAVDAAVAQAEGLLKSRSSSADQERLAEEYLASVGSAAVGKSESAQAGGRS